MHPVKLDDAPRDNAVSHIRATTQHHVEAIGACASGCRSRTAKQKMREWLHHRNMRHRHFGAECVGVKVKYSWIDSTEIRADSDPAIKSTGQGRVPSAGVRTTIKTGVLVATE